MTKLEYVEYIQHHLYTAANSKFKDPRLATQYIVGVLTAQLASAMYNDSKVARHFKHTVQQINNRRQQ